jgi:type I restriction enzyme R subunit
VFELFDPAAKFEIRHSTNLPHWHQPEVTYFVTFRTEDSIPTKVQQRWYAERAEWLKRHGIVDYKLQFPGLPLLLRQEFHERFSRSYMENLDKGLGACVLARRECHTIVAKSLLHFTASRYHMGDFVVMPNHVHAIVCLLGDTDIEAQCESWKRYTARKINKLLKQDGRFWQEESFDHLIRSPKQFAAIQRYIWQNPQRLSRGQYFLHQLKQT